MRLRLKLELKEGLKVEKTLLVVCRLLLKSSSKVAAGGEVLEGAEVVGPGLVVELTARP